MEGASRRPTLSSVRRTRPGRVALEVDERPWRVVPEEVALRLGLGPGVVLDRPLLRALRRELRRTEARNLALGALTRRDLSTRRLRDRLDARGVPRPDVEATLARLSTAGVLDDGRLARARAEALEARGLGDAAIRSRLEREGLPDEAVRAAIGELGPEAERAARVASSAGSPRAAWRLLLSRGFDADAIDSAVGSLDEGA